MQLCVKKSNIVLTGFMGAGKTTVGKLLARRLNLKLVDTDREIEKKTGMDIFNIFDKYGEERFREIETGVVEEVAELSNCVIVTGGGIILRRENIERLRRNGVVVYLHAEPDVISKRVIRDKSRPLLQSTEPLEKIKELMNIRKPFYENYDIKIDTSQLTVEEVVNEIINKNKIK